MNQSLVSAMLPALGLLLLMGLLAWGVHWLKKRMAPVGSAQGAQLRLVAQIMLGPQQRVVVVELNGPEGPVQLTLGVTAQQVSALHAQSVQPVQPQSGLAATALPAHPPFTAAAPPSASPAHETLYQKVARSLANQSASQTARTRTPEPLP